MAETTLTAPGFADALRQALAADSRYLALALVDLNRDQLLFCQAGSAAPDGLEPALHDFLLRLVADVEGLERLRDGDETLFYDLEGRQVVSHYRLKPDDRWALVAVIAPDKTYKQSLKRLVKALETPGGRSKRSRRRET